MARVLVELSDALAGAVALAGPSVVRVEGRERMPASGIVWSADGTVLTAHHAVERDDDLRVGLPDGSTVPATLAGRDPATDLAVLRVQAHGLAAATVAPVSSLRVGHITLALGRPGQSVRATMAIVSAIGGAWRTPAGGRLDHYLQADVTMHPGFSGGPLVDASGRVVAMNTSGLTRGLAPSVAMDDVRGVVDALLTHGRVRRGYLGITPQPVRLPTAIAERTGQETALLLSFVESGGPADKAGLILGDVIVAIDGDRITHYDGLLAALADSAGKALTVRLLRGGVLTDVHVTIGERS